MVFEFKYINLFCLTASPISVIVESEVDFPVLQSTTNKLHSCAAYLQVIGIRAIFSENFSSIRSKMSKHPSLWILKPFPSRGYKNKTVWSVAYRVPKTGHWLRGDLLREFRSILPGTGRILRAVTSGQQVFLGKGPSLRLRRQVQNSRRDQFCWHPKSAVSSIF